MYVIHVYKEARNLQNKTQNMHMNTYIHTFSCRYRKGICIRRLCIHACS